MSLFGIGRRFYKPYYRTDRSYVRKVYSYRNILNSRRAGNVVRREKRLRKAFTR